MKPHAGDPSMLVAIVELVEGRKRSARCAAATRWHHWSMSWRCAVTNRDFVKKTETNIKNKQKQKTSQLRSSSARDLDCHPANLEPVTPRTQLWDSGGDSFSATFLVIRSNYRPFARRCCTLSLPLAYVCPKWHQLLKVDCKTMWHCGVFWFQIH